MTADSVQRKALHPPSPAPAPPPPPASCLPPFLVVGPCWTSFIYALPCVQLGQGGPKIALRGGGGDGMGARRRRGGGAPEMGFRAGLFVLCKDGCCHQRRRNTNFGPENFFSLKNFPPHMCSQNDHRDVGIILSHVCWGRTPPLPRHGRKGSPSPNPPPGTATKEGEGGVGKWASVPSPPRKAIFFSPRVAP